jgi:diketogulonate reductase-like aldo/keto reductase
MSNWYSKFKLPNGVEIPALGFGVYLSSKDETAGAVQCAISKGYRLIDTAAAYGNEEQVGDGIAISDVERDELFVTTKLWMSDYGYDEATKAFETSLRKLKLDYLDLYLLHWPSPSTWDTTIASWRAAEHLLNQGRVRAIGVCNFTEEHLRRLSTVATVTPAVNQIELHPLFSQRRLREVNARFGVLTQAWSPIGGTMTNHPKDPNNPIKLLEHPDLVELGRSIGKTPAQVVLRWHLQNGVSAIPKSVTPERIASNFEIFDFALSDAQMATIDALDTAARSGPDPDEFDMAFLKARRAREGK